MVKITFYEKPGCINNTKQKKLLAEAGYKVDARNLLTEPWTAARLLAFFNNLPVNAWFNQSAPAVKSGEVIPDTLTADQAIRCILADPILIRRPLMELGDTRMVGFEQDQVNKVLGLGVNTLGVNTKEGDAKESESNQDLERCPKEHS
jgi:nitrogenase-associated protein